MKCFKKRSEINNITFHLKKLEKQDQIKCKASKRKEIVKIRVGINELEKKSTKPKFNYLR